jgi:hypothetical protein
MKLLAAPQNANYSHRLLQLKMRYTACVGKHLISMLSSKYMKLWVTMAVVLEKCGISLGQCNSK